MLSIILVVTFVGVGYYCGIRYADRAILTEITTDTWWEKLPSDLQQNAGIQSLQHIKWKDMDLAVARKLLTDVLDASKVPHGDISVPSNVVHSRRYVISQWQRSAVGASVIVLGYDNDRDLSIALGVQRGMLRNPQGYMEVPLPNEDLTGLKQQGASRLNGSTMTPVPADQSIQTNAVREVYEEVGLTVNADNLILLDVVSDMQASPRAFAARYMIILPNTPELKTYDQEFVDDDLSRPMWVKIKDIKYDTKKEKYFARGSDIPVDANTIQPLNKALQVLKLHPIK